MSDEHMVADPTKRYVLTRNETINDRKYVSGNEIVLNQAQAEKAGSAVKLADGETGWHPSVGTTPYRADPLSDYPRTTTTPGRATTATPGPGQSTAPVDYGKNPNPTDYNKNPMDSNKNPAGFTATPTDYTKK